MEFLGRVRVVTHTELCVATTNHYDRVTRDFYVEIPRMWKQHASIAIILCN